MQIEILRAAIEFRHELVETTMKRAQEAGVDISRGDDEQIEDEEDEDEDAVYDE